MLKLYIISCFFVKIKILNDILLNNVLWRQCICLPCALFCKMLSTRFTVISSTSAFSIFECNCSEWQEKHISNKLWEQKPAVKEMLGLFHWPRLKKPGGLFAEKRPLTSASAMRTLSSCKLSLMRALLFFSTRGFLICKITRTMELPFQLVAKFEQKQI